MKVNSGEWRCSISAGVGVIQRKPDVLSLDDLMKDVDQAVYEAKRKGRNCVAKAG